MWATAATFPLQLQSTLSPLHGPTAHAPMAPAPHARPNGSTRAACCTLGECSVNCLTIAPRRVRCFGYHDGARLFLHSARGPTTVTP